MGSAAPGEIPVNAAGKINARKIEVALLGEEAGVDMSTNARGMQQSCSQR